MTADARAIAEQAYKHAIRLGHHSTTWPLPTGGPPLRYLQPP